MSRAKYYKKVIAASLSSCSWKRYLVRTAQMFFHPGVNPTKKIPSQLKNKTKPGISLSKNLHHRPFLADRKIVPVKQNICWWFSSLLLSFLKVGPGLSKKERQKVNKELNYVYLGRLWASTNQTNGLIISFLGVLVQSTKVANRRNFPRRTLNDFIRIEKNW